MFKISLIKLYFSKAGLEDDYELSSTSVSWCFSLLHNLQLLSASQCLGEKLESRQGEEGVWFTYGQQKTHICVESAFCHVAASTRADRSCSWGAYAPRWRLTCLTPAVFSGAQQQQSQSVLHWLFASQRSETQTLCHQPSGTQVESPQHYIQVQEGVLCNSGVEGGLRSFSELSLRHSCLTSWFLTGKSLG